MAASAAMDMGLPLMLKSQLAPPLSQYMAAPISWLLAMNACIWRMNVGWVPAGARSLPHSEINTGSPPWVRAKAMAGPNTDAGVTAWFALLLRAPPFLATLHA